MNKYGICTGPSLKSSLLDEIGEHFLDHAVELVKAGSKFVFVLDNIDWEEKAHDMRMANQNKSVHAVATTMVFDRVMSDHFPDDSPQKVLKDTNFQDIVRLNEEEIDCIRTRYRILIAKHLKECFAAFASIHEYVPQTTHCFYQQEMSVKSDVITMPVLMKDEKKYSDCVDVLDTLEEWAYEIYSAAGRCSVPTVADPKGHHPDPPVPPHPGASSKPDQPASHIPPAAMDNDPLRGVKIPCFGDQLTRVRFAGAKDLRAGCHSPRQRIDHIYPYRIVDWHSKQSFLKVHTLVIPKKLNKIQRQTSSKLKMLVNSNDLEFVFFFTS